MAKRQLRFKKNQLEVSQAQWLGQTISVVLQNGVVYEVYARAVVDGRLHCSDGLRLKHAFPLDEINEIILYFPVVEHAQTSAD